MKKVSLFLVALMTLTMQVFAERVTQEDAALVATNFMNPGTQQTSAKKAPAKRPVLKKAAVAQENEYYVFENADGEGWVMIAANDVAHPIIAYSNTGQFRTDNQPANLKHWLGKYDKVIRAAEADGVQQSTEVAAEWQALRNAKQATAATVVGPLIQTTWDQDSPFCNLCPGTGTPASGSTRAYTGCVATAMAQVMYYWKWPVQGNGSHSYQPLDPNSESGAASQRYSTQSANFGETTYDWDNMKHSYSGSSTSAQKTAVATLMYHCGVATEMMYGNYDDGGSGTYTVNYGDWTDNTCAQNAFYNFFRYKKPTGYMRDGYKSGGKTYYTSWTEANWIAMLKAELDAKRPIMYAGAGSGGGHSFVCDGYDSSDKFHFNWGWSGDNDGFYSVNSLVPGSGGAGGGSYDFSEEQDVIIGIEPDKPSVAVTSITLNPTTLTLKQNEKATLTATVLPTDAQQTVKWTSSDEAVATVANGIVTGKAQGTARITAAATDDSGIKAECNVTVTSEVLEVSDFSDVYESNVTLTTDGSTSASAAKVIIGGTEYDALKFGTSKIKGEWVQTIPAGTTTLYFHAAAWTGSAITLDITAKSGAATVRAKNPGTPRKAAATVSPEKVSVSASSGVSGNSPFTITDDVTGEGYYFEIDVTGAEEGTTLTFTPSDKRFVVWGVNAKTATTEVDPDAASITADPTSLTFEGTLDSDGTYEEQKTIDITGANLNTELDIIEVSISGDPNFSITSPTPGSNGKAELPAAGGNLTVTCTALDAGTFSGTLSLLSIAEDGETEVTLTIPLSATIAAPAAKHTVTWWVDGVKTEEQVEETLSYVKAAPDNCDNGRVFVGWTSQSSISDGQAPADLFDASQGIVVNSDATYYAVFATATPGEGGSAANEVTLTFSEQGYENGAEVTEVAMSNCTLLFDKGTGTNAPKYYTSGQAVRAYKNNTLTITSESNITAVSVATASGYAGTISADNGTYANGAWSGSSKSIVLTHSPSDNAQWRITAITVTTEGSGSATTYSDYSLECAETPVADLYILGQVAGNNYDWNATVGTKMNYSAGVYTITTRVAGAANAITAGYLSFTTAIAESSSETPWDDIAASRLAGTTADVIVADGQTYTLSADNVNNAFCFKAGTWTITVDLSNSTMTVALVEQEWVDPVYYLEGYWAGDDQTKSDDTKFVEGALRYTFTTDAYVYIASSEDIYYNTVNYVGSGNTATFYTGYSEKFFIPAGTYDLTLTENTDGSLTLTYVEYVAPVSYDVTVAATTNGTVTADPTSAVEGATVTLTVTPDEGYQLASLTVTDANENNVAVSENTFVMPAANVIVTATFEQKPAVSTTADVLNNANTINSTSSTYSEWTATGTSGAEYAGQSAGGNSSIQLRSNGSNSGIVVTKSAGNVASVKVTFNTATSAGRVLSIYGSNTAYTAVSELYSADSQGTLIQDVTYAVGSEEQIVTVSDEYAYIGIRSKSGAQYIDQIEITWAAASTTPKASIVADPASVSFTEELVGGVVDGAQQTVTITAENLNTTYNEINVSLKDGSADEFTVSPAKLGISGGTITIQLDAIAAGDYTATIVVESLDADENVVSVEIPVTATVTDPTAVPTTYDVTVAATTNGTVTADPISAIEGATVTLTVIPDEGYQLAALTVTDANDNTVAVSENSFVMPAANVIVTATFEQKPAVSTTADVLNNANTINSTSSTYSEWTATGTSGAEYAGQSAGGNSSIQLRSNGSNSGIVVTKSAGNVASVKVTFNTATSAGRVLSIYGSNTAYTAVSELYSADSQGTLIQDVTYAVGNEEQTVTVSDEYAYIGIRSKSGAQYVDEIEITWAAASTTPKASITADHASVSFTEQLVGGVVDGAQQTVTITAENLNTTYNEINVSLKDGSDDEFTVSPATLGISGGTITIQLDAIAAGNYTATIVVESLDANEQVVSIEIPVTATVTDPTVVPTTYDVTIAATTNGTVTADQTSAVEGATVTLTVTPDEGYQLASLTVTDANDNTVTVSENSFIMPAANVKVTTTFEQIPEVTGDRYVLTDLADIAADDVVIITMSKDGATYALFSNNGTSSAPTAVAVTVADDAIVTSEENIYWNISNSDGNLTIYVNGSTESWLYTTAANNGVRVGTNTNSVWTVDTESGYLLNSATTRYMGVYNNADWRAYTTVNNNITGQTLAFYVKQSGTTPKASIVADPASVSFTEQLVGGVVDGAQQTVTITAENLNTTYNEINVSLKDGSDDVFTVSPATLGISGGTITIQLDAIAAGNYTATIVVESLDANEQVVSIEIPVTATVTDPTVVPTTYDVTIAATTNGTVTADQTSAVEGATVTLTVTPDEGYQLASLTVTDANDNTVTVSENTFVMPAANVTVTATFEQKPAVSTTADVLNNANTVNATTTSYSEWTATGTSGAEYAGNSAGGNGSIQLRSNNSTSGIVVTKSAGNVASVKVTFNTNTTAGRVLSIYGSNTAYTAVSELYSADSQGTLIQDVTYAVGNEEQTVTVSDEYAYIGIRSKSGAQYVDEIEITWAAASTPVEPTVTYAVAGSIAELGYDATNDAWDATAAPDMTLAEGTATLALTNISLAAGDVSYKIIAKPEGETWQWLGDPDNSGDNYTVNADVAGTYDLTIIFDVATQKATATLTLVEAAQPTVTYAVAGSIAALGYDATNDVWDATAAPDMTVVEGVPTLVLNDIVLEAGTTITYKIIAKPEGEAWTWNGDPDNGGDNYWLYNNDAGTYRITITLDVANMKATGTLERTDYTAEHTITLVDKPAAWGNTIYLYAFTYNESTSSSTEWTGAWPGIELTADGDYYTAALRFFGTVPTNYSIIFSDGTNQTWDYNGLTEGGYFRVYDQLDEQEHYKLEQVYRVNIATAEGGSVSADTWFANGETVSLIISPADGYELTSVTATDADDNEITIENDQFTMPASNVNITAVFSESVTTLDYHYEKVLADPGEAGWANDYLIVYEADENNGVAFNGALETLDAAQNTIAVTIITGEGFAPYIQATDATVAAEFTLSSYNEGYAIKNKDNTFIGRSNDTNGMNTGTSELENAISYNATDACIDIVSAGGAYLRYNATSGQERFRYFKSSTYTGQKAIQLYRKTAGSVPTMVDNSNSEQLIKLDGNVLINSTGKAVGVYSVTGQRVTTLVERLDVRELPAGVYIISNGNDTFKLVTR